MSVDPFFLPVSGFDLPRFAGIPTFMRLPHVGFEHERFAEVEIGLIGAPWDGGTTNRPGPRHGPRPRLGLRPHHFLACHHFGHDKASPEAGHKTAERQIGNASKRCQQHRSGSYIRRR